MLLSLIVDDYRQQRKERDKLKKLAYINKFSKQSYSSKLDIYLYFECLTLVVGFVVFTL